MIKLTEINRLDQYTVAYRFNVTGELNSYFWRKHFVIKYEVPVADIPDSILALPFVGAVFPAAMICQDTVRVPVLDRAFYNIYKDVLPGFRSQFTPPMELDYTLIADELATDVSPQPPTYQSAALFSGGIDSTTTFFKHRDEHPLLITIFGSEMEYGDRQKLADFQKYSEGFAAVHHTQHSFVQSNMRRMISRIIDEKLPQGIDEFWTLFQFGPLQILLAAPLLWYYHIPVLYVAANVIPGVPPWESSTYEIDDFYRFGESRVVNDSHDMDRLQKVVYIHEQYEKMGTHYPLRVCLHYTDANKNCGHCSKCLSATFHMRALNIDLATYGFPFNEEAHVKYFDVEEIRNGGFNAYSLMLQRSGLTDFNHVTKAEREYLQAMLAAHPHFKTEKDQEFLPREFGPWQTIRRAVKKAVNRMKK